MKGELIVSILVAVMFFFVAGLIALRTYDVFRGFHCPGYTVVVLSAAVAAIVLFWTGKVALSSRSRSWRTRESPFKTGEEEEV